MTLTFDQTSRSNLLQPGGTTNFLFPFICYFSHFPLPWQFEHTVISINLRNWDWTKYVLSFPQKQIPDVTYMYKGLNKFYIFYNWNNMKENYFPKSKLIYSSPYYTTWFLFIFTVPSQCVVQRTLNKKQMLMSVATKIAIQLNCKLGGEVWALEIPVSFISTGCTVHN